MSKKEINAWDRFWLSVKEYEKVIWVVLLVLLTPTFAFTTPFYTWMSSRNPVVGTVFGRKLKSSESIRIQRAIMHVGEVQQAAYVAALQAGDYQGAME